MKCPYCQVKVRVSDVEADDGTCPECGAMLMGSGIFGGDPDSEEFDSDTLYDEDGYSIDDQDF